MSTTLLALVITWSFSYSYPYPDRRPDVVWGPFPTYAACNAKWLAVLKTLRAQGVQNAGDKLSMCTETVKKEIR
jgi:hypothetical protein